ncbi:hypothetical protein [Brevundimonas sp. R86498]|uniref:hypothetical protein n=1 Tax=Brevundimonas sp. R86498 TaxID=3093845 RepID=UPI0037CB423F
MLNDTGDEGESTLGNGQTGEDGMVVMAAEAVLRTWTHKAAWRDVRPLRNGAAAYAPSDERAAAIKPWTDDYNLSRPHSGIKGSTPWQRVNTFLGNDS